MNKQPRMIDAAKLLEWLKIREEEAYANAAQTLSPSLFKGKADAFNDVAEYLNSGHFDPIPLPTIKELDDVKHAEHGKGYVKSLEGASAWVIFYKIDYDLLLPINQLELIPNE